MSHFTLMKLSPWPWSFSVIGLGFLFYHYLWVHPALWITVLANFVGFFPLMVTI